MKHDRRTFLRVLGAGSIGATVTGLFSGSAAAATVITMEGAGADIWNEQDEFHYYHQRVSGDFDIVVHNLFIENTTGWAKCGLMVRESLDPGSKNLMVRRTPGEDASIQWRSVNNGGTDHTDSSAWIGADWLRLKREGEILEAYASADGRNWTTLMPSGGRFIQDDISLSDEIHLGLAVTSHVEGTLCTAIFEGLDGLSPSEMTNQDIGSIEVAGSVSIEEGVPFVSTGEATDVEHTTATLNGSLDDLGQADSAQVCFEYREDGTDSWTTTSTQTLSSTSSFSQPVTGLSRGTEKYEFRVVADTNDGDSATGSVEEFTTSSIVSIDSIENVGPTSATLHGSLDLVGTETADVYFEYRNVPRAEWTATDAGTLTSSGSFGQQVSKLTNRRYYQVRAVVETGDGATLVSPVELFSTPNPSNSTASQEAGPESTSHFDPGDGFAEAAPWLDDGTPIIKITEPTRGMVERSDVVGERLVVFETSGTIDLDGDLSIRNDRMYLAGQTAPSPGITFIRGGFYIDGDDCVVQHIRARAGDAGKQQGSNWAPDSLHTGDGTKHNVIDHCTATWGVDETLSVGFDTESTTVTNSIIAEALWHSQSIDDTRGTGSIGAGDGAENISWMGCIWANNVARSPRLDGRTAIVNNVVYHVQEASNLDPEAYSSIVGNGFIDLVDEGVVGDPVVGGGHAYLEDNYTDPEVSVFAEVDEMLSEPALWPDGLEAMASENVFEHNLRNAGARPADRTPHDERVIEDIWTGGGEWIDSQEEVGGYPDLEVNSHTLNVPNGGTRAWIRMWARRVEMAIES